VFAAKTGEEKLPAEAEEVPRVQRFRARLVAHGDSQTTGVNFNKTYAPVFRFISLRIILHVAALNDWEIEQGDFVSAFLNVILKEFLIYGSAGHGLPNAEVNIWTKTIG